MNPVSITISCARFTTCSNTETVTVVYNLKTLSLSSYFAKNYSLNSNYFGICSVLQRNTISSLSSNLFQNKITKEDLKLPYIQFFEVILSFHKFSCLFNFINMSLQATLTLLNKRHDISKEVYTNYCSPILFYIRGKVCSRAYKNIVRYMH